MHRSLRWSLGKRLSLSYKQAAPMELKTGNPNFQTGFSAEVNAPGGFFLRYDGRK